MRNTGSLILGVDGGNTKTVALVADVAGRLLGAGRGGCADIYGAPSPDDALDTVAGAVAAALTDAGATTEMVRSAAFCMAGADWPEDLHLIAEGVGARLRLGCEPMVLNDAYAAVHAGHVDGIGVAATCGTYVAIGAEGPCGARWHTSWLGPAGGAVGLGEAALRAVFRELAGVGPATSLKQRALDIYGARDVSDLLHQFTRRTAPRSRTDCGWIAPAVLDEAESGDSVAGAIVQAEADEIAAYSKAAARAVGLGKDYRLVLLGAVLHHPSRLLLSAVGDALPEAEVHDSADEPAVGAVRIAAQAVGASREIDGLAKRPEWSRLFVTSHAP